MRPLASMMAAGLIALGAFAPPSGAADTHSDYLVRDGIAVYYAIVPAERIRLYPKHSPEAGMHGGVPTGRDQHHLMVALFDAKTLMRIDDAKLVAAVTEAGFAGKRKRLEPFTVNDAITYCNYFRMARRTHYRIHIAIKRSDSRGTIPLAFVFRPD